MPNQRKRGKKKVGLWVDGDQERELKEMAKAAGMTVSDLIKEAISKLKKEKTVK